MSLLLNPTGQVGRQRRVIPQSRFALVLFVPVPVPVLVFELKLALMLMFIMIVFMSVFACAFVSVFMRV